MVDTVAVRRLSIARSFRLALLGLAVVLAGLAGVGVAELYSVRQTYEDRLAAAYGLEASAGKLLAASVVEEATLRLAPSTSSAARRARAAFGQAAADARVRTAGDPQSTRLVDRIVAAQASLRRRPRTRPALEARAAVGELVARQRTRRVQARQQASSATRRALLVIGIGGALALALAVALVTAILESVRRPLAELVDAAERLAAGELSVRVDESSPGELAELGGAFNAMAADLQRATAELEAERQRLAVTIESLGDALLVTDDRHVVRTANPRAGELVPEAQVGAHLDAIAWLPGPIDALAGEVVVSHGGRSLAVTASRLGFAGEGLVWTVRDVSERARLERLKSEFVSTASHELRSPLTSIKGFVELLHASPGLTDRQREFVDIVLTSTNRLVDLVNDLLDVARVEAGRLEVHPRPTDVVALIHEVTGLLGARLVARDQDLEIDVPDDLPPALADPGRLRQVLTNLLTNAHLYTPEGGRVRVGADATDTEVLIEVTDTGRGMTPEQLEHAFERFYRAGDSSEPGTGLGLAIVKALIDLQGGTIDVRSAPGEGTSFLLGFARTHPVDPESGPRHALRGKRVLVVDDEEPAARLVGEHLEPFGVDVTLCHDGRAALAELRERRYDAMTLDIFMPGMSGFEVLRALRADSGLQRLPVVVVSVFSGREALSGESSLDKPVSGEALADALGSAMLGGRVRVLAVGRPNAREEVARLLDTLGLQHEWAQSSEQIAAACEHRRFEVALVESDLPEREDVLRALELRGRRLPPAVVLFSTGTEPAGEGAAAEPTVVRLENAGAAILAVLQSPTARD